MIKYKFDICRDGNTKAEVTVESKCIGGALCQLGNMAVTTMDLPDHITAIYISREEEEEDDD